MLTDAQIKQFRTLYRRRFGTDITAERAAELGIRLVNLMRVIYRPITAKSIELSSEP